MTEPKTCNCRQCQIWRALEAESQNGEGLDGIVADMAYVLGGIFVRLPVEMRIAAAMQLSVNINMAIRLAEAEDAANPSAPTDEPARRAPRAVALRTP